MSTPRLLSGEEIVTIGATKANVSLPEIGLKDVTPNGSWLEQKQIQSSLYARKQLIEIERIEKWGTISHAVWREELMLAEVTKKTGGHWQYLGHNKGYKLYLKPEEALYLMEVNCLQLKYNEVTVSMQQAYTLLLRDQVSIMQYKVYASLSRLGYKVFRFSEPKPGKTNVDPIEKKVETSIVGDSDNEQKQNNLNETAASPTVKEDMEVDEKIVENISDNNASIEILSENKQNSIADLNKDKNHVHSEDVNSDEKKDQNITNNNETNAGKGDIEKNVVNRTADVNESNVEGEKSSACLNNSSIKEDEVMDVELPAEINEAPDIQANNVTIKDFNRSHKARILSRKHLRSQSTRDVHKYFDNFPDLLHKESVIIIVPKQHLPEQVNPMYASYEINLNTVRTRKTNSPQPENVNDSINTATTTTTYNTNERRTEYRFESTFSTHQGHNNFFYANVRFHRPPPVYNQFQFWRPRLQWNAFPYNVFIQRPFIKNTFYASRFHFFPRQLTPAYVRPDIHTTNPAYERPNNNIDENSSSISSRKRARNSEQTLRFDTIKNLAMKLKNKTPRYMNMGLINFIESLIQIYNGRYNPRIYLTDTFDIEENEIIVDTITLDDDEVVSKKRKVGENSLFEENFCKVQELALKLKDLESKGLATARHRRALSSVVKTFNESFNADIYVNESYQVVDRRHIVLDSSSESDCVVKESEIKKERKKGGKRKKTGKKVRNPFNLLKTLAEKNRQGPSSRKDSEIEEISSEDSVVLQNKDIGPYSEEMKRNFKSWLPKSQDFGRAETVPKSLMISRIVETNKLAFLYDFIKHQTCKFINWLDVKISFLENMEYASALFNDEHVMEGSSDWNSIIKPEDCKDMPSVLNKLSIIPNKKDTNEETSLKIDFDVYNRDVLNFKKTNVPKAHFRIICIKQSSGLPPGPDVTALHTRYGDVPIVFAIVGESVSYLQIKPFELPVFIPEGESV